MNSNAGVGGRRVLHQPFFPVESSPSPPRQTPSPPPPSTDQSPFFPTLPSPPPPSSSSSLASFPANISSLPIPHSSPSPKTHVSPALISVTVALALLALSITLLSLFLFLRNRLLRSKHPQQHVSKPHTPSPSSRSDPLPPPPPPLNSANNSHLKNSSEFLYLGTMANSSAAVRDSGVRTIKFDPRKTDSPDLQPLPPLSRRNGGSSVVVVVPEDAEEEEEFFSPRGSANGSASARAFSAAVRVIEQDSSPDSSSSSSHTCSPPRSASLSISPPVTGTTKSPPVEDDDSSPERDSEVKQTPEEEEAEESPLLSNGGSSSSSQLSSPVESPCLSPLWSMAGKSSPPAGDWSMIDRSQTRLSPISDRSILSSKTSSIIKLPRFLGGGGTGKGSPESAKMSNSPESSLTASPMSRSSSSKISYSPGRNAVSNPESPVISSRWSNQSSPEVRHLPNIAVRPPAPPPPPPPPLPTMRQRSESPVLVEQENNNSLDSSNGNGEGVDVNVNDEETPKLKLKPLHWDKVRASSDKEMVWDQLRSSSFKLNEEMIETLFVVKNPNLKPKETSINPVVPSPRQDDRVLDPKKAQNIAISLRALNVTVEEVCEALLEGNAEMLGTDLLESLLKMAPTKEEEWKLREYKDDSPCKLGHAERFLKTLICIPFAFKRVEAMLYVTNFESEVEYLKKSFETLENACDELRSSRMFLKLLEAVLKTGNRMNVGTNRGDAHAFKLDTLHKLVDVKGADGKTTLLHFVVQEMIRTEGARLCNANQTASTAPTANEEAKCRKLGLQVVSCLGSELANVKKAAAMDSDSLTVEVAKLSMGLAAIAEVVALNEKTGSQESSRKFSESMNKFIRTAEEDIIRVQAQESVALSLVKEITEYFHGDSAKEEAHPFRIFMVVRDFLAVLDRVCKEVGTINDRTVVTSGHRFPVPVNPMLPVPANPTVAQSLTELFHQYKRHSSSSEGESSS